MNRDPFRSRTTRGFTLIEAIIATLLVGIVMIAALGTLGATTRARVVRATGQHGDTLARELMSEIMAHAYKDPGATDASLAPEGDEVTGNRLAWDDVDDYHAMSNTPPTRRDGTPMEQYTDWTRSVGVHYVQANDPSSPVGALADTGLKRITVAVTDPLGTITSLVALRSDTGAADIAGDAERTFVSHVGIELQLGTEAATRVSTGGMPVNQALALGSNLLANGDLESGLSGWFCDDCNLGATSSSHGGTQAMEVSDREEPWSGPAQSVSNAIVNGASYSGEVWVRVSSGTADISMELVGYADSGWVWQSVTEYGVGTDWRRLRGMLTPTWTGNLDWLAWHVETESGTTSFYIDDAQLRLVSTPEGGAE